MAEQRKELVITTKEDRSSSSDSTTPSSPFLTASSLDDIKREQEKLAKVRESWYSTQVKASDAFGSISAAWKAEQEAALRGRGEQESHDKELFDLWRQHQSGSQSSSGSLNLLGGSSKDIEELNKGINSLSSGVKGAGGGLNGFVAGVGQATGALVGGAGGGGLGGLGAAAGAGGGGGAGLIGTVAGGLAGAAGVAGLALVGLVGSAAAFGHVVDSLVEQVGGFSMAVVQASVRSRIQELQDRMRLAREAGGTIANLERTRSDINSEIRGIIREAVELFGPLFNDLGDVIKMPLEAIRAVLEFINDHAEAAETIMGTLFPVLDILHRLLAEARKARKDKEKEQGLLLMDSFIDIFRSGINANQEMMDRRAKSGGRNTPGFL